MRKLFLLGIKHSGKTMMMKTLSSLWGIRGIDSDELLEPVFSPLSVREWYRANGKDAFMREEAKAVSSWLSANGKEEFVMSLGGGAAENGELIRAIKGKGLLVYLSRKEEDMLPVILKDGIPPFLDGNDIEGSFHRLYERRDALLEEIADITIELGPYGAKESAVETLLSQIREAL